MKKYELKYSDVYIGTAREIRSLYKNFLKKTEYFPVFSQEPVFNASRMYGLSVRFWKYNDFEEPLEYPEFMVVKNDTAMHMLE